MINAKDIASSVIAVANEHVHAWAAKNTSYRQQIEQLNGLLTLHRTGGEIPEDAPPLDEFVQQVMQFGEEERLLAAQTIVKLVEANAAILAAAGEAGIVIAERVTIPVPVTDPAPEPAPPAEKTE